MAWWFKKNKIKQLPKLVEIAPKIHSVNINGEKYLRYEDVISFMMEEDVDSEIRWALDRATFFTKKE